MSSTTNVIQFPARPRAAAVPYSRLSIHRRHGDPVEILVDTEDLPRIEARGKLVMPNRTPYSLFTTGGPEIALHRFLMAPEGEKLPDGIWVDHRNRDTRDYRKANLRYATPAENLRNTDRPMKPPLSGQTGVYPTRGKWSVCVSRQSYGTFDDVEEAKAVAQRVIANREGETLRKIAELEQRMNSRHTFQRAA